MDPKELANVAPAILARLRRLAANEPAGTLIFLDEIGALMEDVRAGEPDAANEFDPLQALSLARTALSDPAAVGIGAGTVSTPATEREMYAIDRIDEVIGALYFEPVNDARSEAVWVITHLGRLLAHVAAELPDRELSPATFDAAADELTTAGDAIDRALDLLESKGERDDDHRN
jgi:hypothetical protein